MASKDPKELPKHIRQDLAIDEYHQVLTAFEISSDPQKKKPHLTPIALYYGLVPTTLARRIAGKTRSHQEAHQHEQRLSPAEEQALESWVLQVAEWGWPPRVTSVRHMAKEMLAEKDDHKELGINWVASFLRRHPDLQSRFSQPLDKERVATHDPAKLLRWFQLVGSVIQKYDIQTADTYNMDEKGSALGSNAKTRVICSKHDVHAYKAQDGSREWVSLIECISADGRLLAPFIIFKGKRQMKAWYEVLEDEAAWIAMSENGWTNNVLGLEWFIRYVQVMSFYI